jgi:putative tryptophan/tyrosine transport system substrate-binding protein
MQFNQLKRRELITLFGSAAAAWPLVARAQQAGKLPTIGFMGTNISGWRSWTVVFVKRLSELGWVEGRTIAIEYRWSEGRPESAAEIAAEFVRLKVDVIVTMGTGVPAFRQATSTIPIVFTVANDPLGGGLVESLARPGGNVTGLSLQSTDAVGKRIELLREAIPQMRRLSVIFNIGYPAAVVEMGDVQTAARSLGLQVKPVGFQRADDIASVFAELKAQQQPKEHALYVINDALVGASRTEIIALALDAGLPTMFNNRNYVESGGLMSYGASYRDQFRRTAEYVDKILHGTKPGDIPVEQPTKFELVVHLNTAKALGLTMPESFLLRADEVIE